MAPRAHRLKRAAAEALDLLSLIRSSPGSRRNAGSSISTGAINVTTELLRRGYTEEQIAKLWCGNLLRALGEVECVAKQMQAGSIKS